MTVHDLKTAPEHFEEVIAGRKKFELRLNDRNYGINDRLCLREFTIEHGGKYTGRTVTVKVTHAMSGEHYQGGTILSPRYIILSIELVPGQAA